MGFSFEADGETMSQGKGRKEQEEQRGDRVRVQLSLARRLPCTGP